MRNELSIQGQPGRSADGRVANAFEFLREGIVFIDRGAALIGNDGGAEPLELGERFEICAFGSGAIAERKGEQRRIDVGVVERR